MALHTPTSHTQNFWNVNGVAVSKNLRPIKSEWTPPGAVAVKLPGGNIGHVFLAGNNKNHAGIPVPPEQISTSSIQFAYGAGHGAQAGDVGAQRKNIEQQIDSSLLNFISPHDREQMGYHKKGSKHYVQHVMEAPLAAAYARMAAARMAAQGHTSMAVVAKQGHSDQTVYKERSHQAINALPNLRAYIELHLNDVANPKDAHKHQDPEIYVADNASSRRVAVAIAAHLGHAKVLDQNHTQHGNEGLYSLRTDKGRVPCKKNDGQMIPSALIKDNKKPRLLIETFSLATAEGQKMALNKRSVDKMVGAVVAGTLTTAPEIIPNSKPTQIVNRGHLTSRPT